MTYLPQFARVLASVHMLTPAWGQAHEAPMTRTNLAEANLARTSLARTDLAMTEIAKGELKHGDRLMAEAAPPAPPHAGPPDRCDAPRPGSACGRWRGRGQIAVDRSWFTSTFMVATLGRDRDLPWSRHVGAFPGMAYLCRNIAERPAHAVSLQN